MQMQSGHKYYTSRQAASCDVLVIGAGAAGLAAALRLTAAGRRVIVLEARDRVGGRAWSVDVPLLDVPVEIGPEFVHGHPEVTLRLLHRYGIERIETTSETWQCTDGRGMLDDDDDDRIAALMQRAAAALPAGQDATLLEALALVNDADEEALIATIASMARGFDAADPADASFRAIHEEWLGDASLATASSRVVGGYRRLWRAMCAEAKAGGARLFFSTAVRRIDYDEAGVLAHFVDGQGVLRRIHGQACIVTVPLGVLQRGPDKGGIVFSPPLPSARLSALARLAMGPVVKVHALFEYPFWERLDDGRYENAGFFRAPRYSAFPTFWTTHPARSALLTGWAGGNDVAGEMRGTSVQILGQFFSSIEAAFGAQARAEAEITCTWAHVWDWRRDVLAYGAYSYAKVDGLRARALLGEPLVQRLYFAGEAYAGHGEAGTVAGALETGETCAELILAAV